MNKKAVLPLVFAVLLGLVAAYLVKDAIARRTQPAPQATNLVSVVIAKQNVEPGKQLGKEDLAISKIPAEAAPGQIFSDPTQLAGRVVTTPLIKGQTILETLLAPAGAGGGLQALVPPGMRAMTFEVNEFSGVGGMLQPGCHVDVITLIHDDKKNETFTRTILQNIKVEAIGHNTSNQPPADGQPAPPPSNAITVLCTPKQAQILQLAMMSSRPWLMLRSGQDGKELPSEGTTIAELRGDNDNLADAIPTDPSMTDNGNDAFANATPPQPAPTLTTDATQQQQADAIPQPPPFLKRTVQVLRGGAESSTTFVIPNPRANATADVSGAVIQ
jgi:pilus assembly protein CpaB